MRKHFTDILLFCAVALSLMASGCGSANSQNSPTASHASNASQSTVFGVASLGTTTNGTVSLKDSSVPSQERTAAISSNGSYTIGASKLTPPLILKAAWTDQEGNHRMYSASTNGGRTNINPLSDVAVTAAANGKAPDDLYEKPDPEEYRRTADNLEAVINSLRTVLAPLFALYQASGNPVTDDNEDENSGLSAMLRDVKIVVTSGMVIVTNRQTGGVIFSGPLNDLASGTFHPENMPTGPGGSTTCTSFTYTAWGDCQPDSTQTRTVLTKIPAGCTGGTPDILSRSCVYVPPVTTCTSFTYTAWGDCQPDSTQTRTVLTKIPAGCTGGTPDILSRSCVYVPPVTTCTSFTYTAWGDCQPDSTQTRTVLTKIPAGCTGGTPDILSRSCVYVPPTPVCGSCHTIPPSTGQHTFHTTSVGLSCGTCHGTGYSSTTVNTATHNNGVKDVVSTLNFNATARTCSPGCHGSRTW